MTSDRTTEHLRKSIANIRSAAALDPLPADAEHLKNVITALRDTSLRDFEEKQKPRLRILLDAMRGKGVPVAVLSVCGRGTQEIRYTQLLRYFLDPGQPHGLGHRVLQAVLKPELESAGITLNESQFKEAVVEAEVNLGKISEKNGHSISSSLDLLVKLGSFSVLIEHKIRSPESGGRELYPQLIRYIKAIQQNPAVSSVDLNSSLCLFVTPGGVSPRDGESEAGDTAGNMQWRCVTHRDFFRRCVQLLTEDRSLPRVAVHNLCTFLWDMLLGPMANDGALLSVLTHRLQAAIDDPQQSFALKRWCQEQELELDLITTTVEECYAKDDA